MTIATTPGTEPVIQTAPTSETTPDTRPPDPGSERTSITFFLTRDQRNRVLRVLRSTDANRTRALLRLIKARRRRPARSPGKPRKPRTSSTPRTSRTPRLRTPRTPTLRAKPVPAAALPDSAPHALHAAPVLPEAPRTPPAALSLPVLPSPPPSTHPASHTDAEAEPDDLPASRPESVDDLVRWVRRFLGVSLVRTPIIDGHASPVDYLAHSFFEGRVPGAPANTGPPPSSDCVVWANRGGGKTFLGALATLLDLVYKPGIQIRILGGSLEQSRRMYEHLRGMLNRPAFAEISGKGATRHGVTLTNGSRVELLAASQTSVRGTRVQKVLCDEVELFDPDVWDAAQLTTRAMPCPGPWGDTVPGSVHALSTLHRPYGLMWKLVEPVLGGMPDPSRPVLRWGLIDVLEHCPPSRACAACPLQGECAGRAKLSEHGLPRSGHVRIADAIAMKQRVGRATWDAEMLCLRPRRDSCVYADFDLSRHVYIGHRHFEHPPGAWVTGMDFGIRSEAALLLGRIDARNVLHIVRERIIAGERLSTHLDVLRSWLEEFADAAGPARLAFIGIDPAGKQRTDQTGLSNFEVLRSAGLNVRARALGTPDGIAMVRSRIAPAMGPGPAGAPEPRLVIHASCTRLIECMQRYHFDEDRPECEIPVKDGHDHACDALRYLVVNLDARREIRTGNYAV